MAKLNVLGASISPPLDPERVGDPIGCLKTLRRVQKTVNRHIDNLKALKEKDLSAIFVDQRIIEDHTSKWYGFTHKRIDTRLYWFQNTLTPALKQDLTRMDQLLCSFSDFWDGVFGARISKEGKVWIEQVHTVWRAIEWSLECQDSKEPYRVEALSECNSLLSTLSNYDAEQGFSQKTNWTLQIRTKWFQREPCVYSFEIPEKGPRAANNIPYDTQRPPSDSQERDLEKCPLEDHNQYPRVHSILPKEFWMKEFWLVTVCLITAVIYSAVTRDVQTGFTIAGVLLGSGNILLLSVAYNRRTRKNALE